MCWNNVKYSLVSINKWDFSDIKVLFNSSDLSVVMNKYNLVLKYAKYIKKLSPNKALHRSANLKVFNKLYKELHTKEQIFPGHILQPNLIVLRDNETNLVISNVRMHTLVGGFVPHTIDSDYFEEKGEVNKILTSLWQDYTQTYNFKYFNLL